MTPTLDMQAAQIVPAPDLARSIYQRQLDVVTRAFLAGRLEEVLDNMAFPNVMETAEGTTVIRDATEMMSCLQAQAKSMQRLRVTEYHRICTEAAFTSDAQTEIVGRHVTHFLSGGQRAVPPYEAVMTLRLVDDGWRSVGLRSALRNRDLTVIGDGLRRSDGKDRPCQSST